MNPRPQKITLGEMRASGVRGVLIYCADYHCSHSTAVSADQWPDDVRLSDLEDKFVCTVCGQRGADVRPDFRLGQEASGRQLTTFEGRERSEPRLARHSPPGSALVKRKAAPGFLPNARRVCTRTAEKR